MQNSFFDCSVDAASIRRRVLELDSAKVGFYSVGLYPASLAYNCAMQNAAGRLMLAARPGRDLLGAFSQDAIDSMDTGHVETVIGMGTSSQGGDQVPNTLRDLIQRCELVVLSANSNHVEEDLQEACRLRDELGRDQVVLACLAGSFNHDPISNTAYVLCEKQPNLAFFSGFHRHGALRNPFDSFTANFCHPNALTAMLGAQLLDRLSPNIQVAAGVHNVEGQYIKAAKNMASVFAGFGYAYHQDNPGVLPTLLTLLLDQCLDQAATVSMARTDRQKLYHRQPIPLTELGYAVPRIEATLVRDGDFEKVRDHTFSQLTAMVADVRGSMMLPVSGSPTRNFQAGQVLADKMRESGRCPASMEELEAWCEQAGLRKGALEGLKSLRYWPLIARQYAIPIHDASMVNLLYMAVYGRPAVKETAYRVMTESRELSNYCQESVRPTHARRYAEALQNLEVPEAMDLVVNAVIADNARRAMRGEVTLEEANAGLPAYLQLMDVIESQLDI
ncbi:MAG: hypothetical protein CBE01_000470 [Planctomycetaceae bacterium TMED241]|jgi:hypothetical protein|uniref:hypothetical protein n=1 Tax=Synechococcales TaxID=1890424 RepID=UPI0004E04368|nr:hypothetical protein [Synechococcus sp. KORDI-49]MBL6738858.1 hypothetical protein [Synechococcus sp. BS301-5m-G54]MBL6795595.1 hypothetical protein [Synechococcus sp. BS307-5m-G34]RCL54238.1 MAG: hypothetical protein DBW84_05000 [Synechococcus sp. MED-G70]RPG08896.1 MAG: hypothetical protein CBE01_005520 [Planctomycetaceae bacterium TMED241]HCX54611.1 hypothetical protein [Synechococcus sp. UBA9887]|tara:strand:+ start:4534 stop:6045 length:1512 start_codon:yes stop_codon:yes gene_type:complete